MNEINISDDKTKLDAELIHKFLLTSYWAKGRTIEEVKNQLNIPSASEFIKMISKSALQEL